MRHYKPQNRGKSQVGLLCVAITNAYRKAIDYVAEHDGPVPSWITEETEKISHREYSTGFYMGTEPGQSTESGGYIRNWDVVAICESWENGIAKLSQRNKFLKGERADALEPGEDVFELDLKEIFDEYMNPIDSAPHTPL